MAESIISTGDVEEARQFIARMSGEIDERMVELRETVQRIRDCAKHDERDAVDRAYAEIEPLRRQMEAMIQSVATVESLKMPPPTIRRIDA